MALNSIADIIEDIRQGKMVILMDDEDRENEGDLIVAAEKITPDMVNFMVTEARGLVCLTLSAERCDYLGLLPMTPNNGTLMGTAFTVSIEAAQGVTTGISAADRAHTIKTAVDPQSKPEDLVHPGHVFPIRAQPGGVLSRAGHTEASCDLTRLAGLTPAAAIVEIMNPDGSMARRPDLEIFAERHGLKIGTIADLIQYRMMHEQTVEKLDSQVLETVYGTFDLWRFRDNVQGREHWALTLGELSEDPAIVRVTSADVLRDALQAHKPERGSWSVPESLKRIAQEGRGVLVILDVGSSVSVSDQFERFYGEACDSVKSPKAEAGTYLMVGTGSQILRHLGIKQMRLLSSPVKYSALSGFDLEVVEFIPQAASPK